MTLGDGYQPGPGFQAKISGRMLVAYGDSLGKLLDGRKKLEYTECLSTLSASS